MTYRTYERMQGRSSESDWLRFVVGWGIENRAPHDHPYRKRSGAAHNHPTLQVAGGSSVSRIYATFHVESEFLSLSVHG